MPKLNQVVGQAFECPLCGRDHEVRSNKANNPFFRCSKFGTSINIHQQGEVFLDTFVETDGEASEPADDAETTDQPTDPTETDTSPGGKQPWEA